MHSHMFSMLWWYVTYNPVVLWNVQKENSSDQKVLKCVWITAIDEQPY